MNTKMSKRQRDLKSKLMAAIAMLLVSSIMMVSTTYAWFTLSTAPEVTGINTSVGANGNLEMALLPMEAPFDGNKIDYGITSAVGDGADTKTALQKNVTWGNLVDLEDAAYGLDNINLYPAALNVSGASADSLGTIAAANPLSFPKYGADGRVTELSAATNTSVYDTTDGFMPNNYYGVRAVGSASGMTERQQTYRVAKSNGSSAASTANSMASSLLKNNGSSLGNIAIQYGANSSAATFTYADIVALNAMATGLDAVFDKIEESYLQYMLSFAASAQTTDDAEGGMTGEAKYQAMKATIASANNDLNTFLQSLANEGKISVIPQEIWNGLNKLGYSYTEGETSHVVAGAKGKVSDALNGYNDGTDHLGLTALLALETDKENPTYSYTWAQVRPILVKLANPDNMTVCDIPANQLKDRAGELASAISGGINIKITTGGGVFADVAEQTGNYTATGIQIPDVSLSGMNLGTLTVNMMTDVSINYLSLVGAAADIAGSPSGGTGNVAITDMYGYIIDLAFKTNAAGSKLVLQQTPVDRIYTGNTAAGGAEDENGLSTMGHGANMTFTSTNSSFDTEDMKALMDNIVIVFFNANGGKIVHYAKLDTVNATEGANGALTAKIKLAEAPTSEAVTNYAHTTNETETATGYSWTIYWKDSATAGETDGVMLYRVRTVPAVEDDPDTDVLDPTPAYDVWQEAEYETTTTEGTEGQPAETTTTFKQWKDITAFADEAAVKAALQTAGAVGVTTPANTYAWSSNQEIMDLPQNTAVQLSALVFLDGTTITNADVSATGSKSLTGTMNLQFSSTATLTPMNYTPLVNTTGANTNGGTATEYTVAVAENSVATLKDAAAKPVDGTDYVFELTPNEGATIAKVEYVVGEASDTNTYKTLTATDGKYTIPAAEVKGNITIKVS